MKIILLLLLTILVYQSKQMQSILVNLYNRIESGKIKISYELFDITVITNIYINIFLIVYTVFILLTDNIHYFKYIFINGEIYSIFLILLLTITIHLFFKLRPNGTVQSLEFFVFLFFFLFFLSMMINSYVMMLLFLNLFLFSQQLFVYLNQSINKQQNYKVMKFDFKQYMISIIILFIINNVTNIFIYVMFGSNKINLVLLLGICYVIMIFLFNFNIIKVYNLIIDKENMEV